MLSLSKKTKRARSRSASAKPKKKKTSFKNPVAATTSASIMPTPQAGPGTKTMARLIYVEKDITVSPGLGSADSKIWSLSGLWDPYISGVGHQPTGFDQMMALYEQYLVISAKITVWYSNTGASGTTSQIVGISVLDDLNGTTDCRRYMENGNTVSRILSARGDGTNIGTLSSETNLAAAHGLTATQYGGDDVYRGSSGNNPPEQVYAHVWAQAMDTSDTADVQLVVQLEYLVEFSGGKLNQLS